MATVESKEVVQGGQVKQLRDKIEKKTGKTTEQLYEERERRITDAIQLRQPDRVPVAMGGGYFSLKYAGLPLSAAYYDPAGYRAAVRKTMLDFEPDVYTPGTRSSGASLEALDPKHTKWPGGTLPPDISHQAIEQEYMKEDEYDLFLEDPTDFVLRYLLPRAYGALAPLAKLPSLTDRFTGFPSMTPVFTRPELQNVAKALLKSGQEEASFNEAEKGFDEEMAELGFPLYSHGGGAGGAPFDAISDFYRGMRGAMTDMYRHPDQLLAACDKILQGRIRRATPAPHQKPGHTRRTSNPLHRGAETFMSKRQFETFYWPGLKKALLTSINLGYVPMPFCEGMYLDRLEYFLELPKGKVVCFLDQTDMARAKDILKDHVCIKGNVPSALLQIGSPQDVEEYCRQLIKVCGKGGGFILSSGSSIDEAKPANIKAMIDSAKKFSP